MLTMEEIALRLRTPDVVTHDSQIIPWRIEPSYVGDGEFRITVNHNPIFDIFSMSDEGVEEAYEAAKALMDTLLEEQGGTYINYDYEDY